MRKIIRPSLEAKIERELGRKQEEVIKKIAQGTLKSIVVWEQSRRTNPLLAAHKALREMMGQHERCIYCHDSHGTDIDHFWPKTSYPERMFVWLNMVLCCSECGRFKGDRFPLEAGVPLLIDPTMEEPWLHLDFDPQTGNIVARFDRESNSYSSKGTNTVCVLHLDRREALAAGYRRTFLRLTKSIEGFLAKETPFDVLWESLRDTDDHGLLGWCLVGTGQNVRPFDELRNRHPDIWARCAAELMQLTY
jgi:uncharacterized protein (TIGR02646 family)